MYARRLVTRDKKWPIFLQGGVHYHCKAICCGSTRSHESSITHAMGGMILPHFLVVHNNFTGYHCKHANPTYKSWRSYSSKGDGRNADEGKHTPVKDSTHNDRNKLHKDRINATERNYNEHARLGEHDQQEWLKREKLSYESRKRESPFLTKRDRFKNEFLRRIIPWDKINISWDTFPYYINEHVKNTLVECAASHLKHKKFADEYGARLNFASGRILLQSISGTELYLERLVRALARDLQVPLLVLDSSILAPSDLGEDCASESETDEENIDCEDESTSESETDDENNAANEDSEGGSETRSGGSDDEIDVQATVEALKKHLVPYTVEDFEKLSQDAELAPSSRKSDSKEETDPRKSTSGPLRKGDRVKYVGVSLHKKDDNRILLGKIPTSDGSTSAYAFVNGRSLSSGQRGEVYEVNGDQVAVILDNPIGPSESCNTTEETGKSSIYWIDAKDIVLDSDFQSADWYIAIEALCEVLPSLQPVIVYFMDPSEWLSRSVPKSNRKEFICKVGEMLNQLSCSVVLICGRTKLEATPKEKGRLTMVLPQFGRAGRLPIPLTRLTNSLKGGNASKENGLWKLFPNALWVPPPKEDELLRIFNTQMEEDRRITVSRNNLCELTKVFEENNLSCMDLLHVQADSVILTKQKAEKAVGWARNHYLSSCDLPYIKSDRLQLPRESVDVALSRLREQDIINLKSSQNFKSIAKDEYESNFVSAVVPPGEIGIKFSDIGALDDVKRTLNELVTLPMRRPELFSHGNLLRPCKGILLFGPPGTGKTLLAKALATEAGANFISITGSSLTSKWFGDAEKLTKALFSFASKLAPVIVFVDEVDSLLGARGGAFEHEATRRMRNEFMAAWDGLRSKDSQRIIVLGATNRPFDLDDAVIRRLPRRIYIDLPNAENRLKILKIFLESENLDTCFKYDELANATEGYSGSDLKNLCIAAAYRPVQELLEEEKKVGANSVHNVLRPLKLADFMAAKTKVGASVAYDAASMNELRRWNDQYGEGGSRRQSLFGF